MDNLTSVESCHDRMFFESSWRSFFFQIKINQSNKILLTTKIPCAVISTPIGQTGWGLGRI
jgi:hypothetical protein